MPGVSQLSARSCACSDEVLRYDGDRQTPVQCAKQHTITERAMEVKGRKWSVGVKEKGDFLEMWSLHDGEDTGQSPHEKAQCIPASGMS